MTVQCNILLIYRELGEHGNWKQFILQSWADFLFLQIMLGFFLPLFWCFWCATVWSQQGPIRKIKRNCKKKKSTWVCLLRTLIQDAELHCPPSNVFFNQQELVRKRTFMLLTMVLAPNNYILYCICGKIYFSFLCELGKASANYTDHNNRKSESHEKTKSTMASCHWNK